MSFAARASGIVLGFEGAVDEEAEYLAVDVDDVLLDILEDKGRELREAVEAALEETFHVGAAFGGVVAMAEAIRGRALVPEKGVGDETM